MVDNAPTGPQAADTSRFLVEDDRAGIRLDAFVAAASDGALSRSRAQALIADGQVTVDGATVTIGKRKLAAGEIVAVDIPPPADPEPLPEPIPLTIVFEDEHLVVIDKPAGLVVHPGPGNWTGTLVNALIHHCGDSLSGVGGVKRPGIVHRLDKDTSGLLVVAKSDAAHQGLADQFAAHGRDGRLSRAYLALVWGVPLRPSGTIDAALGRSTTDRVKRAVVPPSAPTPAMRSPASIWSRPRRWTTASRRWSNACWRPAAPTRSASTWRISAIPSSATTSMAPASAASRGGWRTPPAMSSSASIARPCTPSGSASCIRSPARIWRFRPTCRPIWWNCAPLSGFLQR